MAKLLNTATSPRYSGPQSEIRNRILDTVNRRNMCDLEEVLQSCSSYTWNQVFLEVDRLSRTGELRLFHQDAGEYPVTFRRAV